MVVSPFQRGDCQGVGVEVELLREASRCQALAEMVQV